MKDSEPGMRFLLGARKKYEPDKNSKRFTKCFRKPINPNL